MAVSIKLIFVIICFLAGTSVAVEVPVSSPTQDSVANKETVANDPVTTPGMRWQMLPGEDIYQIAGLMFPKDLVTRNQLIRAIIDTNPEHFPGGIYQPLPPGTIVHMPALRTISAYSKPTVKSRKSITVTDSTQDNSQVTAKTTKTALASDHLELQLFTQLQRTTKNESREFNTLTKRIESLAAQIPAIQSMHASKTQKPDTQSVDSLNTTPQESNLPQAVSPGASRETSTQIFDDLTQPNTISDAPLSNPFSFDTVFIVGILLIVLIIILILRNYRKIQERLTRPTDASLHSKIIDRQQYDALFLNQSDKSVIPTENLSQESSQMASDARLLIKQNTPEAAAQFLQKQLAINRFDISGWLLLFELYFTLGNKKEFKKNARRFKRLGQFPDIWVQIQALGHRLEPDELLYFDERKRKEKFFSDAPVAG